MERDACESTPGVLLVRPFCKGEVKEEGLEKGLRGSESSKFILSCSSGELSVVQPLSQLCWGRMCLFLFSVLPVGLPLE